MTEIYYLMELHWHTDPTEVTSINLYKSSEARSKDKHIFTNGGYTVIREDTVKMEPV